MRAIRALGFIGLTCGLTGCETKRDEAALKEAKASEATVILNKIARGQKRDFEDRVYDKAGSFLIGSAGPTPAKPCCENPDKKCHSNDADWNNPVWDRLRVHMDRDFRFQYSYVGTATEFTASATGDVDCDGHAVKIVAHGSVINGTPTFTVDKQ